MIAIHIFNEIVDQQTTYRTLYLSLILSVSDGARLTNYVWKPNNYEDPLLCLIKTHYYAHSAQLLLSVHEITKIAICERHNNGD
jgi:hypothetical protein